MKTPSSGFKRKLRAAISASACMVLASGCAGFSLPFMGCDDSDEKCGASPQIEAQNPDNSETSVARTKGGKAARSGPANAGAEEEPVVLAGPEKATPYGGLTPEMFGKISSAERTGFSGSTPKQKVNSLGDVIRSALKSNPQIGIAIATHMESEAAIQAARAGYFPTLDVSTASGQNTFGSFKDTTTTRYWDKANGAGTWRSDLRLGSSFTVYDFGTVASDVKRARTSSEAAGLRSAAMAEDITYMASQLYVQVILNRELLSLAIENLEALKGIENLIKTSAQNGNATQADLKRVEARVLDAESARTDQELQLKASIEKFIRVTSLEPGNLRSPPVVDGALPRSPTEALDEAIKKNPQIKANAASVAAARAEVDTLKSNLLPRLSLETSAQTKSFVGQTRRNEVDVSSLLTLSYKLLDGGLGNSKAEQANARLAQAQLRDVDGREAIELDVRQQYLQLASARAKREGLLEGVKTSANARELYQEQFTGGKRTLLELLEVQNAYYSAKYNAIVNNGDVQLSAFNILRSVGRLSETLMSRP